MHADVIWIILATVALWAVLCGLLCHRFVTPIYWWPLVGSDWKFDHMLICWKCGRYIWSSLVRDQQGTPRHRRHPQNLPDQGGSSGAEAPALHLVHTEDDDWADQLHEINQLGKFGDLTRPVAHLTHYEVEALIRTLAVPEWVPGRYRVAA